MTPVTLVKHWVCVSAYNVHVNANKQFVQIDTVCLKMAVTYWKVWDLEKDMYSVCAFVSYVVILFICGALWEVEISSVYLALGYIHCNTAVFHSKKITVTPGRGNWSVVTSWEVLAKARQADFTTRTTHKLTLTSPKEKPIGLDLHWNIWSKQIRYRTRICVGVIRITDTCSGPKTCK